MTDVGYVIAAWSITAVAIGGYTFQLVRRVKRAETERGESEPDA